MLEWTCWFVWQRLMKLNYNYASISGCLHHQVTFSTVIHVGIAYSMQRTRSRLFSDENLFPRTDEYEYHLLDSLVWFQESYLSLLCIKYEQGYFSVWMWRQNLIEWHCGQMVKTFDCRTKVKCPSFESTCCLTCFLVFFFFFCMTFMLHCHMWKCTRLSPSLLFLTAQVGAWELCYVYTQYQTLQPRAGTGEDLVLY